MKIEYRRSGRTSRILDFAKDQLINNGFVYFTDHRKLNTRSAKSLRNDFLNLMENCLNRIQNAGYDSKNIESEIIKLENGDNIIHCYFLK